MKKFTLALTVFATIVATALPLAAQKARVNSTGGKSPHETTSAPIDGNRVTITYGRPYTADPSTGEMRVIWGNPKLIPWGKAYRLGADEATLLITQKAIQIGDTTIPAGAYTLYMIPEETGTSKLAFSKSLGKWGVPVDEKNDFARVDLTKETLSKPVNQLTISVNPVLNAEGKPAGGGFIKIEWENTGYTVAFALAK